ncbi:CaiB/BaiF CoA transferase family protein [Mycobacterium sp. NPDC003449]
MSESSDSTAALDGVVVVDLGQYIAAPGATQVLADMGAEVIKVERPAGDQARGIGTYGEAILLAYNRRKKSVVIDLKTEQGLAQASTLLREADVVVSNLAPGALHRAGISANAIRSMNPRIIVAEITGFGPSGPSGNRPGYDIAAQAESGMMSVTGTSDREPQRVGFPVVDHVAAQVAAQAILAALFRRERTGAGDHITISLLDVAIHLQAINWAEYAITGIAPTRRGNGQPTVAPAADLFETVDGAIVVSAYTAEKFARLCGVAGVPHLVDDERFLDNAGRVRNRAALVDALYPFFAAHETEELLGILTDAGIVCGAVRTYDQARRSADVEHSEVFVTGETPTGRRHMVPGLPFRSEAVADLGGAGRIPALGEHTEEILRQLAAPDRIACR